eukprot:scaffold88174_cov57-Attheya_sp.AAC.7
MAKGPVVVQGSAVASPYAHSTSPSPPRSSAVPTTDGDWQKGEKQGTKCNDPLFAILLYINVGAVAALAAVYGQEAFPGEDESTASNIDYVGYMLVVFICAGAAFATSAIMFSVMMRIPETMLKFSLIFVVILSGLIMIAGFLSGAIFSAIIGAVFFVLTLCYAKMAWRRIPFASANLVTAMTAVKSNLGVTLVAYFFVALAFGWSVVWTISIMGLWESETVCTEDDNGLESCTAPNYGVLFGMLLAYFFTHQVLQNSVHVTVAGVVGTWWFAPDEANSCCSTAIWDSLKRTFTTSFGSICFGSLLVAILSALRQLANAARADDEGGVLLCIAECILGCLESLLEYFNTWAFVYVGLYGYSYLEAGKNVFTLFKNRGWEAIIADDLIGNVLFLVTLIVGVLAGVVGIIYQEIDPDVFESAGGNPRLVAFFILMSVIGSSVNAVIVLFAEAPAEFQQHYPELSSNMREKWAEVYPNVVTY